MTQRRVLRRLIAPFLATVAVSLAVALPADARCVTVGADGVGQTICNLP